MDLYSTLIGKIKYIDNLEERDVIFRAYSKANQLHDGQFRKGGEPYIVHPLSVAIILADIEQDYLAIAAALLHDTVEDTEYTIEECEKEFGKTVALVVDGVTKLEKINYSTKEEAKMETFRKMFLTMAKDLRVIIIKLADRVHNMRTLDCMPVEKQLRIAKETLDIYAPLANRLGIQRFKAELEDLSLKYIDPEAYNEINQVQAKLWSQRESFISDTIIKLRDRFVTENIVAQIEGRQKHIYSIYKKIKIQNRSIDEIYDIVAFRVITNSIKDCYSVLGILHEMYTPLPGRFKDYIAMPKPNMYQSIHNTLVGDDGLPFEVQIRTWDMHRVAQEGIAAHWKYKEGYTQNDDSMQRKINWFRQLIEWQEETVDPDDFVESMRTDLFQEDIFVFTPTGDAISLPVNSTPIDFAYAIHSGVGNRMVGAKVNGRIMPINYSLNNGDQVEILTSKTSNGPSRDWLKLVKTSQARSKINQWFKKEKRDENIKQGKLMFESEAKKQGVAPSALLEQEWLEILFRKYNLNSVDDMYAAIGYGGLTSQKAVNRLKDEYRKTTVPDEIKPSSDDDASKSFRDINRLGKSSKGIYVDGIPNCLVNISKCCSPIPGDAILGYITRGRGVSVHKADCKSRPRAEIEPERFIKVEWAMEEGTNYSVYVIIEANNRTGLLFDVSQVLKEENIEILNMHTSRVKNNLATVFLELGIKNTDSLDRIMRKFKKIDSVYEVRRGKN